MIPYLWAVAAVCAGVVLRTLLTPLLGDALPFVTLFPAVFVAAYLGGAGPAICATLLSALAVVYLFFDPRYSLVLDDTFARLGLVLFIGAGMAVGGLGEGRRRAHQRVLVAARLADIAAARAEEETVRAEEEAARAEEEAARAEEETLRAEEAAARAAYASARFERILASITDAFIVVDHDWTISYMNDRAASLYRRRPAEDIGRILWDAFPDIVGGPVEHAYRQAVTTRQVARLEVHAASLDRWLGITAYPSLDGLVIVIQDVTDRRQAHDAMARLAAIVSSSDDAIVGKRLDGTVTSWNTAAERIFGYAAAEMVGQSIYRLIPPELHEMEHEVLQRLARGQSIELMEVERIRRDGERIIIALSISPIRDASGQVTGASSIKRDITTHKRIERALAAESARSRELAQALDATQAIIRTLDGTVTYWSSGSTRLYGWTAGEALGRRAHELLQVEYPVPLPEIEDALYTHGYWEGELVHVTKDERRLEMAVQWVVRHTPEGEPTAVIEIMTDVSLRRQAEERIRQSERIEVVGQLAGGMAHEVNNQMTVVLGATEFLLRRHDLPALVRGDIEQVRAAAERTASITAQLLAFSGRQLRQPQVLDLDETVQGLEGVLHRAAGERSTLVLQLGSQAGRIKVDPGQLAQVLLNLALNARDAMPVGGRLTIETGIATLTASYPQRHPEVNIVPGEYALIAVSDTGHGMSPETTRHIFEPFYTTKPIGKGTGLGLATVYGILKQSGGYIWVYSELGRGTTFKIYLPLDAGPVTKSIALLSPAYAKGEIVLVVEDEPAVRYMISRALQQHGYGVVEASGGHEALKIVERNDGPLHLIVTDVVMPGMDGPELAQRLRAVRPETPVLFISGYTDDDVVRRGLLEAGQPFLQKPFSPEVLVQRVVESLERR